MRTRRGGGLVTVVLALALASSLVLAACSGSAAAPGSSARPTSAASSALPTSEAPAATAQGCARSLVDGMGTPARVGQLVMVGVPAARAAQGVALVRSLRLGGVFLAGRSRLGVAATRTAVDALQSAALAATGMRLEVATDQEGGRVQVLSGPGFSTIPAALVQGGWSTATLAARWRSWSGQLVAAGVTLDLAPVADTVAVRDRDDNPPVGRYDREYGSDPATVAGAVTAVVGAMLGAGLGSTVKHFPGLGRVHANTDSSTTAVDPVTAPGDPNLQPFAAGIAAGTTAVMVSSASYPRLDPGRLAAFSPAIVTGMLRGTMGFRGVIISDDLGKAVAVRSVSPGARAVRFVGAGGDVVLTVLPADAAPMVQALAARAGQDPSFASLVDAAAYRVVLAKVQRGLAACA